MHVSIGFLFTSFIACGICPCTILQRIMCSRSTSLNVDNSASPELDEAALERNTITILDKLITNSYIMFYV